MPTVTFLGPSGAARAVEARAGDSLMAVAVRNGVPGIIGECGGNASCATCHVYVDDAFLARVGPPNELEEDLLDLGVSDRRESSRLACQIAVSEELDGLVVHTPDEQR
ncbi:2Fe-2S iron-sulfur cluster-binding protein [Phytohabitans kaempferiae]|uniref:2Fe-2S iron-sulfur cluster-binding protein n=1 Tax=Phytohabitans kaempferiae TaxID=1620943 RepID=A0ABV6LZ43_9ACTN